MSAVLVEELLHRRPVPAVIAHRGASANAPENTMPAFEAAWATGCGWIETDVQPTVDNVPVLLHDPDLRRTTNGQGLVRSWSARDVQSLDAGSWFTTGSTRAYARTPVPLLADVAKNLGPQRSLLLEIKGEHTREQVLAELAVVKSSGWDDRVLLQSFEVPALRHVQSIEPGRPVGLLVEALHDDPVAICAEVGAVAYNPRHTLIRDRPEVVDDLHAAGIAVVAWTTDHPGDWALLHQVGVDGIITNAPGDLLQWQAQRNVTAPA
jgi:glycerophosphoryl diester phosphodiesterase